MEIYKKIIPNQKLRLSLLKLSDKISDEKIIKAQYFVKTGRFLNLKKPIRYTEKIQWYKLNYRNQNMVNCSDKYLVREYVKSKKLDSLLNDLYGVYQNVDDIDFKSLPNEFIIKATHGSGTNIIVKDKTSLDILKVKKTLNEWLKLKFNYGREWAYYDIKPKIIIEKLLSRDHNNDLPDYKFFCFNGKVEYLYTMIDYVDDHSAGKCSFFTKEFKQLPYKRSEYKAIDVTLDKPKNFEDMIKFAEILSKDFPHVRVDFYNIDGKIIFGELTFYNASGYTKFDPDEFDYILGGKFELPHIELISESENL